MVLGFLRPAVQIEFMLSKEESAFLASSVFWGILAGTVFLGPLGDHLGRKPMFVLSTTISAVCGVASSFSQTWWALLMLRFGVGVGVGGTNIGP